MKKLFFISVFVLQISLAKAQPYLALPDSNATWVIQQNDGISWYYWTPFTLPFHKNETVINSQTYTLFPGVGAYRNDGNGKTFFVPQDSTNEHILQDLSKNVGDTVFNVIYGINNVPIWAFYDFIVDSVNLITDGPYSLKRLYLHSPYLDSICGISYSLIWIEKIGSVGGGFFNNKKCDGLGESWLSCMSFNDTTYFYGFNFNPDTTGFYVYGSCDTTVTVKDMVSSNTKISISPNPVGNESIIQLNNSGEFINEINIYNSQGLKIQQYKGINKNSFALSKQDFIPGIYLAKVISKSGKQYSIKFIVI